MAFGKHFLAAPFESRYSFAGKDLEEESGLGNRQPSLGHQ
jgi:hypothetical protein